MDRDIPFYPPKAKSIWVRSSQGMLAGVCESIGQNLKVDPFWVRFFWVLSILFFGTGILLYLILAFTLPREDRLEDFVEGKILGVCLRISQKTGLEVGLVRFIAVLSCFLSLGTSIFVYILLHFLLTNEKRNISF